MNKLYIGNLPQDVNEERLCEAFSSCHIDLTGVVVNSKGFAFADCKDPASCDKAIEAMNGYSLEGKEMSVEMSVPRGSRTKKIYVRNIPSHLNWEDLDQMLAVYGNVENCEQVSTDTDTASVKVTYATRGEAHTAYRELNGKTVAESILRVSLLPDPSDARGSRSRNFINGNNYGGGVFSNGQQFNRQKPLPELPTRMLVPSQYVGAIIGKGGESIRTITQKTHARIDVHRKDNPGAGEKAITINGSADACGEAVKAILEIVREEDKNARTTEGTYQDDEVPLKILAHNSLIGRLIGKEGRNLKAVQEKVETKIAISNSVADVHNNNAERTIAIFGETEKCAQAEVLLMEKLRSCYENDMLAAYQQPPNFPGISMNPVSMFPGLHGNGFGMRGEPFHNGSNYMGSNFRGPNIAGDAKNQQSETCTIYIPAESVGAMIGSKGSHIRNVSRMANSSIKIVPPEEGDDEKHRRVTIMGNPEGQWRSQYCIFDKLKQEGYFENEHEGRLTSEMTIPASIVGRVIGKGGNNVRELQRVTSSEVVIPRQTETEGMEEVPVKIVGHFFAIQSAQRKIRELLHKAREAERIGKMRMHNGSN